MNWISNYVRPKINSLFSRREVPENLWSKCPECGTMLFHRELSESLGVCGTCDHHMPLTARDRFSALFDNGVYVDVPVEAPKADPLGFKDQKTANEFLLDLLLVQRYENIPQNFRNLKVKGKKVEFKTPLLLTISKPEKINLDLSSKHAEKGAFRKLL